MGLVADALAASVAPELDMKALVVDIETRPARAYVWGTNKQFVTIDQIDEPGAVLCFAAKWLHRKNVLFHSDHHDGHAEMVQRAWELFDQADVLIHYNGRQFDVKHLHREFALAGMPPPSPHKDVDLLTAVRGRFRFDSHKLDYVARRLELGGKESHAGFGMWRDIMERDDPKAWAVMRRYNIGDVKLTEALYWRVLPWIRNHPNVNLYGDPTSLSGCPHCGFAGLEDAGSHAAMVARYQLRRCPRCKAFSRFRDREPDTTTRRRSVS